MRLPYYLLKYKSLPAYLKYYLSKTGAKIIGWLTGSMKACINKIIGDNSSTEEDITEAEANTILARIVGGDIV